MGNEWETIKYHESLQHKVGFLEEERCAVPMQHALQLASYTLHGQIAASLHRSKASTTTSMPGRHQTLSRQHAARSCIQKAKPHHR